MPGCLRLPLQNSASKTIHYIISKPNFPKLCQLNGTSMSEPNVQNSASSTAPSYLRLTFQLSKNRWAPKKIRYLSLPFKNSLISTVPVHLGLNLSKICQLNGTSKSNSNLPKVNSSSVAFCLSQAFQKSASATVPARLSLTSQKSASPTVPANLTPTFQEKPAQRYQILTFQILAISTVAGYLS